MLHVEEETSDKRSRLETSDDQSLLKELTRELISELKESEYWGNH